VARLLATPIPVPSTVDPIIQTPDLTPYIVPSTPNTLVSFDQLVSSKTPDRDPIPKFEVVESQVQIAERLAKEEQDRKDAEERARKEQEEKQRYDESIKQKESLKRPIKQAPVATYCSCVNYARAVSGINVGSIGYAKYHPINSYTPNIGSIMIEDYAPYGHLTVVVSMTDTQITITEANFKHCKKGERTINRNDPHIRGFYY
jgi:hypothetical protein